jgi:NADH:ubiquinone reductase (H+-translocating)
VPAKAVTRGYHLSAIPANKIRIASTGYSTPYCPRQAVQLGLLEEPPRVPSELQHPGQPH